MSIRKALCAVLFVTFAIFESIGPSPAEDWPARPITMVVPFAAGSATDTSGRILAAELSQVLGQQVIIDNIGGGGSMIGTAKVAKAVPDGYQFVFGSVDSMAIAPAMHKAPLYNSVSDFAPVGLVTDQPLVLITRKDLPVSTLREFATYIKANQKSTQFGSSGVGSSSHFACSRLNATIGVAPVHVAYRGSGVAIQDLLGGRIDYFCALAAAAIGPIDAGAVKALAVLTAAPSPIFPDLKTAKQQGVDSVESSWGGFFFPKGTPDAIVQKLNVATASTLDDPQTIERLRKAGVSPTPRGERSAEYLRNYLNSEVDAWHEAVKASGVPIE